MALLKDLIVEITKRNNEGKELPLLGVNKDKEFMPSVANVIGTDLSNYKIVNKRQFATNLMHVDRDELVPVSMLEDYDEALISPAYNVFQVKNEKIVIPEYLLLCFKRSEFDRCAWFYSGSSIRGNLDYKKFLEIDIPLPDIDKQKKIIDDYKAIQKEIRIKEAINNNLLEQGCALCKSVFPITEETNHKLEEFFPIITGKKNTEVAGIEGKYPFFSCSQDILYTNEYSFEGSAILLAGNGDFNIKFYSGKFEAYQRTYVLIPYNSKLCGLIFFIMKANIDKITKGNRGSVISFIVKGMISYFKITLPDNYINYKEIDMLNELLNLISINEKEIVSLHKLQETLLRSIAQ